MKKEYIKVCQVCGLEFTTTSKNKRMCTACAATPKAARATNLNPLLAKEPTHAPDPEPDEDEIPDPDYDLAGCSVDELLDEIDGIKENELGVERGKDSAEQFIEAAERLAATGKALYRALEKEEMEAWEAKDDDEPLPLPKSFFEDDE